MNKTKIILLSIGGSALVIALVLGYLTYSTLFGGFGDDEFAMSDTPDQLREQVASLMRAKIYPCQESVKAVKKNCEDYVQWTSNSLALASTGDTAFDDTTPASFKAFINEEAKRLADHPGTVDGHFTRADFGFGFDEYVHKGKLPSPADLPRLQREWNDVSAFLGLLIDAKASSVTEIQVARAAAAEEEAPARGPKRKAKKDDSESRPDITRFDIVFTANSEALVKVLNAIAANPRFIVAESMNFSRAADEISAKLGEQSAKKQEGGGRSRRRGRAALQSESSASPSEDEAMSGVVTDPETIVDFKVVMKIAVYDFRTRAKPQPVKEEQK